MIQARFGEVSHILIGRIKSLADFIVKLILLLSRGASTRGRCPDRINLVKARLSIMPPKPTSFCIEKESLVQKALETIKSGKVCSANAVEKSLDLVGFC